MNNFKTITTVPNTFNMINPVKNDKNKKSNNCLSSFDYFNSGNKGSVYWGSEKPIIETVSGDFKPHSGKPTHSIWNNSTKRKTIVNINK